MTLLDTWFPARVALRVLVAALASLSATGAWALAAPDVAPPIPEGTALVDFDPTGNDGVPPGQAELLSVTALDGGNAVISGTRRFTFTPPANGFGTYRIRYELRDNGALIVPLINPSFAVVSVDVIDVDDPPTAVDDVVDVDEDTTTELFTVATQNDLSFDTGDLRIVSAAVTSGGGTVLTSPTSINYTPPANAFGTALATIEYVIDDGDGAAGTGTGGQAATGKIQVNVIDLDDAPIADDDSVVVPEDAVTDITIEVLGDDISVDTGDLRITAASVGLGTVTITGGGTGLTYQPPADRFGTDLATINYAISDGDGAAGTGTGGATASTTATVTVSPADDAPTAVDDSATTDEEIPVVVNVLANDSEVDSTGIAQSPGATTVVSFTQGGSGTVTDAGAAGLRYTPNGDFVGSDTFTYTIGDGFGSATDTATVTVTVANVDDPPVAADDTVTVNEQATITFSVLGNDSQIDGAAGDPLVVVSNTDVSDGTLTDNGGGSFSYRSDTNFFGSDSFTYTIRDSFGTATDTATVTITVNNVDDAPTAVVDSATTTEDTPVETNVLANDSEVDSVAKTVSTPGTTFVFGLGAPANGSLQLLSGGIVRYTPNPDFFGTDSYAYGIRDSVGSNFDIEFVNVTVTPVDDPPTAADDSAATDEEDPVTISVLANDTQIDGPAGAPLSVTSVTNGSGGNVVNNGSSVTYTPSPDFFGTDTFTYTVRDAFGTSTDSATVTVIVANQDDAPVAVDDAVTIDEDTTLAGFDPLANDDQTDGGALTITAASADVGAVAISGGGTTIDYTPPGQFFGTANIDYTINDGFGSLTAEARIVVTVTSVNDVPDAVDDVVTLDEDTEDFVIDVLGNDFLFDAPVTVVAAGTTQNIAGADFPNSSESAPTTVIGATGDAQTLPNGSVDVQADGTILYTPKEHYNGADFFTYTIEDADGDTATGRVDITVVSVNDPPDVPNPQNFSIVENGQLDIVPSGLLQPAFDPDGDALTAVLEDPPGNGSVTLLANGAFEYTPDINFVGSDSFTYFVNDGTENNAGGALTVIIDVTAAPPQPPPPPPGEVEFDFELAQVPLELAAGVEANVLVIMDDSGSMDWSVLTEEASGRFLISNFDVVNSGFTQFQYAYASPVVPNNDTNNQNNTTNSFAFNTTNGLVIPSQELVDNSPFFDDNTYGIWRIRTAQFNKIYYDPAVTYEPWRGLDPDNQPFRDADPEAALLDPYQVDGPTIDLTDELDFDTFVPMTNRNGNAFVGDGDLGFFTVRDFYIPRYYTTTAESPLEHDDPRTLVEIRPGSTYAGGPQRTDCALDDGDPLVCTYGQEIQNFANWYTYYRSREYTVKSSLGRVVADTTAVRIGYATLNNNNDRVRISEMGSSVRAGNKRALLDQIYEIDSNGGTPLRDSLDEAGRHFECRSGDAFGSNSNSAPGDAACPIDPAPAGQCQQNFTLLFTDGSWSGGDPPNTQNEDGDGSSDFDGGIFADNRSDTLADVAMNYYERDLHPGLADEVPTTARDRAFADEDLAFTDSGTRMHQHMTTFTVGFGVLGTLDPESDIPGDYTASVNWPNPFNDELAKIDDLLHASLNGRGDYLSAANSEVLDEQLAAAFDEFGSGTGAASAVAFNSQQLRQDTLVFRGFYNTKENTGDLVAQLIDVDNDTLVEPPVWSAADALDDKAPNTRVVITWDDIAESGVPFRHPSETAGDGLNVDQIATLDPDMVRYLRGERSNERPLGRNFRERPLSGGIIGDIVNSTPVFVGPPGFIQRDALDYPIAANDLYSRFKLDQQNRSGVVYVGANEGMLHAFASEDGEELFAYIPDKLINGTPYANELFQITSPSYSHKFFNDNTPAINDIFFDAGGGQSREWRTVLIGSLRAGGKGLYALDITDPSDFANEASAAAQVLWEFDDLDDTYPTVTDPDDPTGPEIPVRDQNGDLLLDLQGEPVKDLGYTFSVPTIAMTNVPAAGSGSELVGGANGGQQFASPELKWAAIFGNGYNSTYGVSKLFVNFIEDGADGSWDAGDFEKLDTGFGVPGPGEQNEGLPNGLGVPRLIDLDGNGTADFAYAGDLLGNLFRFDLRDPDPDNWTVTLLFKATYTDGTQQPITTQPIVTLNPQEAGVIVVFATGSFITEPDGTSTDIQSLYGIWDRFENNPTTASGNRGLLVEQTITNLFDTELGALRSISSNTVTYTPSGTTRGWVVDLDAERPSLTVGGDTNPDQAGNATGPQFPGERAIRNLQLRGGFVFVNTIIPRDDSSCESSPGGFAIAMNPITGGAGGQNTDSAFDLDNDGNFDADDLVGGNIIGGLRFDDAVPTDSAFIGTKRFTQLSDRSVDITETNTGVGAKSGRLSWRELE